MDTPSAHAGADGMERSFCSCWDDHMVPLFIAVVDVVGVNVKNRKGIAPLTNVRLRKFVIV